MNRISVWFLMLFTSFLLRASSQPGNPSAAIQRNINELHQRGLSYRFLDNETIELKNTQFGFKRVKKLSGPTADEIRAWAASRNIPILEIDPSLIDTNLFAGMYTYWAEVPLSNELGVPLVVGDVDHNGRPEIYGDYKDFWPDVYLSRVYEVDSSGQASLLYTYAPYRGGSEDILDADQNGLLEVLWTYAGVKADFQQIGPTSLPISPFFEFESLPQGDPGYTNHVIGFIDNDSLTDFLYKTAWYDSGQTPRIGSAIAEWDPSLQNFRQVWRRCHWCEDSLIWDFGGYAAGDFDNDGRKEFVVSFTDGKILVVENTGDNTYQPVWRDSLPFTNMVYGTSGDVDGDGRMEFFRGATTNTGNWTVVYEADADNHYVPTFLFHILAGGFGDEPTYSTTDMDGDGRLEFVLLAGNNVHIFKSDTNDSYYLWYYKRVSNRASIAMYDFDGRGKQSFVLSRWIPDSTFEHLRLAADIYKPGPVLSVEEHGGTIPNTIQLSQNYPNPFNPTTTITYSLPSRQHIRLALYDMLGRELTVLVDELEERGVHIQRWNASGFASGAYFCRLRAEGKIITRKLLLIR